MNTPLFELTPSQITQFATQGYLVIKQWSSAAELDRIKAVALEQRTASPAPLELESELGYPGAPKGKGDTGGNTPRRLLRAYGRSPVWDAHATSPKMKMCLSTLLGSEEVFLTQAHHNCLMTKTPKFSSDTGWHRDSRYWQFKKNELITAWLALSDEFKTNGCLHVIPGSHRLSLGAERFDEKSFLISNHPENEPLIKENVAVELKAGDLLFFHCDLLHSATRNFTETNKLSLVFTYFSAENSPIEHTRSSSAESIVL